MCYLETILPTGWIFNFFNSKNFTNKRFYYEDVAKFPYNFLQEIGKIIKKTYLVEHVNYLNFEHCITSGNAGTSSLIRKNIGLPIRTNEDQKKKI